MSACVPYVVVYTETVIREVVVYAVTADDAVEIVERDNATSGFGEVISVSLQQGDGD